MRLTHVLIGCDLNPQYLDFWPLARRAWREVAGLEPILVLIAEPDQAPEELRDDPSVHVFAPVPEMHTALQAQCIRLLYPALLDVDGAILISDADMVPLNRRYFHRATAYVDQTHFVAYRDNWLDLEEIPICYNAALPETWGEIFGVRTIDDVRARLTEWGNELEYDGVRGGAGWVTDQLLLYRILVDFGRRTKRVWITDDHYTGYRRLERAVISKQRGLSQQDLGRIRRGGYSDFHCLTPYGEFRDWNELAVTLAAGRSAA
jgi:hypothetical protein